MGIWKEYTWILLSHAKYIKGLHGKNDLHKIKENSNKHFKFPGKEDLKCDKRDKKYTI